LEDSQKSENRRCVSLHEAHDLFASLTELEWQALTRWSVLQQPSGNASDLTQWPGWHEAVRRIETEYAAAWSEALSLIERVKTTK
jgi:hypothetical protein